MCGNFSHEVTTTTRCTNEAFSSLSGGDLPTRRIGKRALPIDHDDMRRWVGSISIVAGTIMIDINYKERPMKKCTGG